MSKTINLQNASGKSLHKMSEMEIREMVTKITDKMLDSIPSEIRIADVNSVKLVSNIKEIAESGVAISWERACCGKRNSIENFTDPDSPELGISNPAMEKVLFQNHFDSNMTVQQVTEENSLKKIKESGK